MDLIPFASSGCANSLCPMSETRREALGCQCKKLVDCLDHVTFSKRLEHHHLNITVLFNLGVGSSDSNCERMLLFLRTCYKGEFFSAREQSSICILPCFLATSRNKLRETTIVTPRPYVFSLEFTRYTLLSLLCLVYPEKRPSFFPNPQLIKNNKQE